MTKQRTLQDEYAKQARLIASALAQAVASDEHTEGCDISAGLFGPKASALLNCMAKEMVDSTGTVTKFEQDGATVLMDCSFEPLYVAHRQR